MHIIHRNHLIMLCKLSQTVRFGRVKFNSDTFYLLVVSIFDEPILKVANR
jgi:hypothetical protein